LHPLLSFEKLIADNSKFKNIPSNISMSRTTFETDLFKSNYILYRGSTSVASAISLGLIPIYLEKDNEINIDPIYECNCGRRNVKTVSDFEAIVELKYSTKTLKCLKNYGCKFYMPLNAEKLLDFL
jgi:hypothetical protein